MHQQQHTLALHGFKRLVSLAQVCNTSVAVGGGTCGVKLDGHHTGVLGTPDLIGRQVVGEVQRHEWLKRCSAIGRLRGRCLYALLVGHCGCSRGHRWAQVGHDDGTAKLGGGVGHHGMERVAIAHMQVPIVRAGDGE